MLPPSSLPHVGCTSATDSSGQAPGCRSATATPGGRVTELLEGRPTAVRWSILGIRFGPLVEALPAERRAALDAELEHGRLQLEARGPGAAYDRVAGGRRGPWSAEAGVEVVAAGERGYRAVGQVHG